MKKWFMPVLAVGLCLILVLSSCGKSNNAPVASNSPSASGSPSSAPASQQPDPDADIQGEITIATHRTSMADTKFKEYVEQFKAKYPKVTDVKIEAIKDYSSVMQVRIASGELPDVFAPLDSSNPTQLAQLFAPLNDLGLDGKIYFEDSYKDEAGNTYLFSLGGVMAGLVYSKKAFRDAGIDGPPKTIDELYAAVDKLKAAGKTPIVSNFKDAWPVTYYYTELPVYFAGDPGLANGKLTTDTPFTMDNAYGQAFAVVRKLVGMGAFEKDLHSTDWDQSRKDFGAGKVGMAFIGQWFASQVVTDGGGVSEEIGFVPFPYDNSGKYASVLVHDWPTGVNKNSKNLATAKAWLKFLVAETDYADYSGLVPTVKEQQSSLPQLAEMFAANPTVYEYVQSLPKLSEVEKDVQFDLYKFSQEIFLTTDLPGLLDDYNKKWAEGRKAAGL